MVFNWLKKKGEKCIEKNINNEGIIRNIEIPNYTKQVVDSDDNFIIRLKKGLLKTRKILTDDLETIFKGKGYLDRSVIDRLEELLITSDVGVDTTMDLINKISVVKSSISNYSDLRKALKKEIIQYFNVKVNSLKYQIIPKVTMVVGTNGVGKTTTIGKLATLGTLKGNKILIAAADTFRAAAVEQLSMYARKAGAKIVRHKHNSDPAAVAYDAVSAAVSRRMDEVFIDTAGRLNTKINLMKELVKIRKSTGKSLAGAPHEVLLVLDATTGQNAISQTEKFNDFLGITGIVLTKLDSSSRGGIVIDISRRFNIAIKYICFGEKIENIQKFNPETFIDAII